MPGAGSANSFLLVAAVVLGAFAASRLLYGQFGGAASIGYSIWGLLVSTAWIVSAIWLMLGFGIGGLIIGSLMVVIAVFIGSWHFEVLTSADIRSRMGG